MNTNAVDFITIYAKDKHILSKLLESFKICLATP